MVTAVNIIGGVETFLPFVNNLIVGIEGLFSKKKSGTQKKAIALQTITSTLSAIGLVAPGTTTIAPALESTASKLIDDIVSWKNLTGEFTSTSTTPVTATPTTATPAS